MALAEAATTAVGVDGEMAAAMAVVAMAAAMVSLEAAAVQVDRIS